MIHHGDCLEVLKTLPDNSIDSLVTDPPAGISFMQASWDSDKGGRDEWIAWLASVMRECYRVMKPGAHGLVWALPRTSHWTATALEDAGFRIKDRIAHIAGSGFPKSTNVGKQAYKAGILCQCNADEAKTNLSAVQDHVSTEKPDFSEQGEVLLDEVRRCCEGLESKVCCSPTGDCTQRPCRMDGGEPGQRLAQDVGREQSSMERGAVHRAGEGLCDDSQSIAPKGPTERLCFGAHPSDGEEAGASAWPEGSSPSHQSQSFGQSPIESDALLRSQDALGTAPQSGLHCRKCGLLSKETEGYGSHLKPAVEDWWLIQKPLAKGLTISQNVQEFGTGAINVDASRIKFKSKSDEYHRDNKTQNHGIWDNASGELNRHSNPQGRFPSHLVLSCACPTDQHELTCAVAMLDAQSLAGGMHSAGRARTKDVTSEYSASSFHAPTTRQMNRVGDSGGASRFFARFHYSPKVSSRERNEGLDRSELVWNQGVWENAALLSSVESIRQLVRDISDDTMLHLESMSWSTDLYGHSISEQYPQGFKSITETVLKLITELRTSSSSAPSNIKENILGALREIEASGLSLADAVAFSKTLSLDTINAQTASLLSASNALLGELSEIRRFAVSGNFHSTVKPQKLMRYLARLITPPGGTILDCFAGSGSTGCAAIAEGFKFVGIEKESEYHAIAVKRLEHALTNVST